LTSKEEAFLVLRAQAGDRGSFEALLRIVQPSLTRYVRSIVGQTGADDVTQEVLIAIYRKMWWLSSPDLFRPWMFRIASRAAFRHLKRERKWPPNLRDDDALENVAAPEPSDAVLNEFLGDERITPASRAVLSLHFQEGMTLLEVAAVLDIPVGTAKSRLAYGLATLRRHHPTPHKEKDDD
jgi:RNA polymerase sigma-70 factor (ECF subfamily)